MNALLANIYSLGSLTQNFYLADFFDVIIVTLLLYSAVLLFKQTRSLPALIGIGMLVMLYIVAQIFSLYLTSLALQSFFAVFLVVLVVIFQEELRRFFEFIAAWSTRNHVIKSIIPGSSGMSELLQAIARLAHEKKGALVILSGQEIIERHLEGGKTLDGLISEELILSIFDPTSPGHDGAMIIEKNRIVEFGAHLPLSTNFKEIGKHGTRHSAAVGIAECSDALAIVVSEEQGTISIAQAGKLKTLKNVEELELALNRFLKEKFPEETYHWFESVLKKNSFEKIVSLVIAIVLWFLVAFPAETVQRDFIFSTSFRNLPENLVVESIEPKEVTVALAGRGERAFDRIDINTLEIAIDGNLIGPGTNNIALNETMVVRPLNLSIVKINPPTLQLRVKKYRIVDLPVAVTLRGKPAKGYVANPIVSPKTISLLIPESETAPQSIATEAVDITGFTQTQTFSPKLIIPPHFRLKKQTDSVVSVIVEINR